MLLTGSARLWESEGVQGRVGLRMSVTVRVRYSAGVQNAPFVICACYQA
jgi:hypothetical protein